MATTPKTEAPATTLEQAALVMAKPSNDIKPLEVGKTFRFNAPFGALYHPWDNTLFDESSEAKHVVDDWINLQFTAGKLVVAAD